VIVFFIKQLDIEQKRAKVKAYQEPRKNIMPRLTTSTVAINMHLMGGGRQPIWITPEIIASRLKAHSDYEVTNKLTEMVESGDILRAKNKHGETIFSLTTNPILASN
jgi:hypothetical protein